MLGVGVGVLDGGGEGAVDGPDVTALRINPPPTVTMRPAAIPYTHLINRCRGVVVTDAP